MQNKAMERLLSDGEALDVSKYPRNEAGEYILMPARTATYLAEDFAELGLPGLGEAEIDGKNLCDAKDETWIWSVGEHKVSGEILASLTGKFYQHPEYNCLWLR